MKLDGKTSILLLNHLEKKPSWMDKNIVLTLQTKIFKLITVLYLK